MALEEIEQPFDSIESAQDFMNVLAATLLDVAKELGAHRKTALEDGHKRRAEGIDLALFKVKMLNCYVHKSRIALNDLRTLRRLIMNERLTADKVMAMM